MNQPEDHMDELFRKAGENYPLQTGGSDWDKVLAGLQSEPDPGVGPIAGVGSSAYGKKWRWLLLLLLLPIGWVGAYYAGWTGHRTPDRTPVSVSVSSAGSPASGASAAAAPAPTEPSSTASAATTSASSASAATAPVSSVPSATASESPTAPASSASGSTTPASAPADNASATSRSAGSGSTTLRSAGSASGTAFYNGAVRATTTASVSPQENWSLSGSPAGNGPFLTLGPDLSGANRPKVALPANANPSDVANSQKPTSHTAKNNVHGFYAGALAGPDFTSIKGQAIQNPGYSLGLMLGYRFNRRLSVEASALWDHKAYYTSGEYFNKTKADIPPTVNIVNMNGTCNMFEIPISVRYDFWLLKNGGFYATAGFSSYMMQLETYSYLATAPGYNPWTADKSYPHSGNDFFSMVHLSAGYRFQWGKIGEVRLEPYYKIPLKGVGIGQLPMTSTGLYIGLTHSF